MPQFGIFLMPIAHIKDMFKGFKKNKKKDSEPAEESTEDEGDTIEVVIE